MICLLLNVLLELLCALPRVSKGSVHGGKLFEGFLLSMHEDADIVVYL
jgi:hypothetical protein